MKIRFVVLAFIISSLIAACGGADTPAPAATTPPEPTSTATPADTPAPPEEATAEPAEEADGDTEGDAEGDEEGDTEGDAEGDAEGDGAMKSPLSRSGDAMLSPLQGASPLAVPAPTAIPIVKFGMERPVYAGTEEISGFGPPDLPVVIIDITGGEREVLGSTETGDDGTFETELSRPLKAGHRIGLTIGDLSDHDLAHEDFQDRGFYGDEAMLFPQFGFFYSTQMIIEAP